MWSSPVYSIILQLYHVRIVQRCSSIFDISPIITFGICTQQLSKWWQVAFFKRYICQLLKCSLAFIQQAMYATMPHAFDVQHVYFCLRHCEQGQKLACLETQRSTKYKAGSETAIETVVTPALVTGFESTALSLVATANRIEAYPATGCLLALAWQIV